MLIQKIPNLISSEGQHVLRSHGAIQRPLSTSEYVLKILEILKILPDTRDFTRVLASDTPILASTLAGLASINSM